MSGFKNFTKLLDDFKKLPIEEEVEENIFSICGFPHYEQVASNVLAFFFDNNREHSLGDLFIHSLLSLGGIDYKELDLNFSVLKEVKTDKGNFIDLVLESDSFVIIIENKIYAPLNNDLDDYYNFYTKRGTNRMDKSVYSFVLSLDPLNANHKNFIFIEYESLFEEIKSRLGQFIAKANPKYLILLTDFISNVENLRRGITMDYEFISFVQQHKVEMTDLNKQFKKVHNDLRRIVEAVNKEVIDRVKTDKVKQWAWRRLPSFYDIAVTDIYLKEANIAIDSRIELDGWRFFIFTRNNKNLFNLEKYLTELGFQFVVQSSSNRLELETKFGIQENSSVVASFIVEIIYKLIDSDY